MIALLRQTRTNLYTLNALTGVLDACEVPWEACRSAAELCTAAERARRRRDRALALYSFPTLQLPDVRREVANLRRENPGLRFLAGGPHTSADPEGALALGFDHVFVGEAEETLPAFLASGEGAPVSRGEGRVCLDAFPPFGRGRHGPVELTRGCAFGCGFCAVGGRPPRHRSHAPVLAAVADLCARGRPAVSFITPDALTYGGGLDALEALLRGLREVGAAPALGIFPSEVRPERVTPDAAALLRAHCRNRALVIGGQSGSDAVLRRLGRGHTAGDVTRAARVARAAGFLPHVDLIFGLPEESLEDRKATVRLASDLRRTTGAKIHAHYFHPLPGTPLWGREPTPLDPETRAFLVGLRAAGAEDGYWQTQESWAWQVLAWGRMGWIRTPPGPRRPPGPAGRGGSTLLPADD
ncbi:MAG: TIGR04013 family B12-binding domain/radical SAM domain-containing protein [Deferrisomatales bacterium]|nr:TIGR04013 family B12-binding domain/radical SAM domain-containing protein [Deferrisomatales bacterium]